VDGFPGDYTKEWATNGGGAGSWLKLTWSSPVTLATIVLYDRPNLNDQITSATLTFSNGTQIPVGSLPNDGSPLTVIVPNITTTTLTLTVNSVSSTTQNVGLAEIQAYPPAGSGGGGGQPIASAGAAQTVASGATVTLDGSGSSDPNNNPLTYQWTQTAGPAVTLSSATAAKPTFTAPASGTLTFQLVVNNGTQNSAPSSVNVTVTPDVAMLATATASSQNTATGQTAAKAIDGVVDGYQGTPGDYTKEWATVGGGAGSWLTLTWSSPVTLATIVLYDRPNLNDQITSATLTFSNGTQIPVGSLPNDGSPLTVTVPTITTTTLTLTVNSVSSSTQNVGLAEIQAYPPAGS
jgi:hypothetical protein